MKNQKELKKKFEKTISRMSEIKKELENKDISVRKAEQLKSEWRSLNKSHVPYWTNKGIVYT